MRDGLLSVTRPLLLWSPPMYLLILMICGPLHGDACLRCAGTLKLKLQGKECRKGSRG